MINCEPLSLLSLTAAIFEELGFLTPTPGVSEAQLERPLDAGASVDFDGAASGRLVLRLYGGVLPALAANMLGDWQAPSPAVQGDALGELANVLCGHLLRALYGPGSEFRLASPRVPPLESRSRGWTARRAILGVEDGRAEVELLLPAEALAGVTA